MKILQAILAKNKGRMIPAEKSADKSRVESVKKYWSKSSIYYQSQIKRVSVQSKNTNHGSNNNLTKSLFTVTETVSTSFTSSSTVLTSASGKMQTFTIKKDEKGSFEMMLQQMKADLTISGSLSFANSRKKVEVESKVEQSLQPEVKAICLFGGAATLASVWEILMTQPDKLKGKQVIIISSPMWIEDVNEQLWANQPWGQPKHYLPRAMRLIATDLFPGYPDDKPLTFKMIKDVICKLRELIKEAGIQIIEDEVDAVKENKNGLSITVNGAEKLIIPHHNYHVIHSGKKLSQIPSVKLNHFGNAYKKSLEELSESPMAIVASGLNAIWAIRDFKGKTNLIYIIPKGDRELPMDDFDCVLRLEDAEFFASDEEDRILIRGLCIKNNKKMTWDVHKSEIYSAKGFELSDVVEVDQNKITLVDTEPKLEDLCHSYNLKGEKAFHTNDMRGTVVPPGNLASNCRAILGAVSKLIDANRSELILGDGQAVTSFNDWKEATLNKAKQCRVSIHPEFYNLLLSQIKSATAHFLPHDDQLWELMKRLFNKGILANGLLELIKQPVAVDCGGKPITFSQFEAIFRKPVQLMVVNVAEKEPKEADCEENKVKM